MEWHLDESVPVLGEELEFLRALHALDHAFHCRSRRMEGLRGMTGPQRQVLRLVGRFPGIPAGELANLLHLHPSTLTGVLRRLERRGWIQRTLDSRDRRRSLFGLTRRGREVDAPDDALEVDVRRALARVSPKDLRAARHVLATLARELELEGRSPRSAESDGPRGGG